MPGTLLADDTALVLLASLLAGLAAMALVVAVLPAVTYRRTVSARLEHFVGTPATTEPTRPTTWAARLPAWTLGLRGRAPLGGLGLAAAVGVVLVVALLTRDPLLSLAAAIQATVFATLRGVDVLDARRRLLEAQTLPVILRMAAALRAGASLPQAMEQIAHDGPEPTRAEFRHALDEVAVGRSVDDALEGLARRAGTPDYQALVIALAVQRRVGGNLALVLDQLSEAVRERLELRQEVAALTAQQRYSSWILVLLPFAILAMFGVADPAFLAPLFGTAPGRLLLLGATVLQAVGSWALRWAGRVQ